MKFLRFLTLALIVSAFGISANAQTAAEVNATVKKMMSPSTPCNQGTEPFKQFIAKFSTDKEFMESRLKLTDEQRQQYADLLVPSNFTAKVPFPKDDDEYYQSWGELQFGRAYLECGWVDSYCTHTFEFVRDGQKWYLAKIVPGE